MAVDPRIPGPRGCVASARAGVRWRDAAVVWLPWLAAPLFFALPIGGCGVGERLRHAAARPIATAPAVGQDVRLVAFERP